MWKIVLVFLFILTSSATFASASDKLLIEFQSLQKKNWSVHELKNAELITDFVQNLMNNHNFDYVLERFNNNTYLQHNRNIPNKINGLVEFYVIL